MWQLDYKESWVRKNWYFWTIVLEKTLESHLDCKEFQPVHHKGNQYWIFIERTDAEAKTPILLPPDAESLQQTLMLGEIEGGRRRGWQRMRCWMVSPTQWTTVWVNSGNRWWNREAWSAAVHGVTKSWTLLRDWTELNWLWSWIAFQIHINPFYFPLVNFLLISFAKFSFLYMNFCSSCLRNPMEKGPC